VGGALSNRRVGTAMGSSTGSRLPKNDYNVLAIALANKLARIAWGVLAGSRTFEASKLQVA
jgi:hypothetical protein